MEEQISDLVPYNLEPRTSNGVMVTRYVLLFLSDRPPLLNIVAN